MTSQLLWTLIAIQIFMGAFDTIYHHELTERLAWRPSQKRELQLHAVRNWLYAVLFICLGWLELHGLFAILVALVLGVEVVITLMDFVEEDLSRSLPASERINHTLLALNYGAILVLLTPVLLDWADKPTALFAVSYGYWSWLASVAAVGVAVFGLRDYAAAHRSERLAPPPASSLDLQMGSRRRVLVTGATGFIGRRLVAALIADGHHVTALVRDHGGAMPLAQPLPPPVTLITNLDQIDDDTWIDAIVNLAGEPIANGLWTVAKREKIMSSRIGMTRDIVAMIARLHLPPKVLVNGSAIGWYGLHDDQDLDETSEPKTCFTHELCSAWETEADKAIALGLRVVKLRIGLVLGIEGGVLANMLTPFEFCLGGPMGSGQQWMSWIMRDDLIRLIGHAIATGELSGPVNATAPKPVTNSSFSRALGKALHRPAWFRSPAIVLRVLGGQLADELLLGGQHVLPTRALASGFVFRHVSIDRAFNALLNGGTTGPAADGSPCDKTTYRAHSGGQFKNTLENS